MPFYVLHHYGPGGEQSIVVVHAADEPAARRVAAHSSKSPEWVRRWLDPDESECLDQRFYEQIPGDGTLVVQRIEALRAAPPRSSWDPAS